MPLMNNILFSYNYINFHKKSPSQVNRPIPKRIILSTIWHTKTRQESLAQSVSLSILLIKSFLYTFLLICLWDYYTISIFFSKFINISKSKKPSLIAELWFYLNSPVISFEDIQPFSIFSQYLPPSFTTSSQWTFSPLLT